jgi:glycogen synthase
MVLTAPTALWVVPVSDLAGVARHVLDVARVGVPGWRLVFLTPPGDLPDQLREIGVEVVEGPFGPDHGLRASVATLRDVVRREQPAVVHSHLSYADIVAALAVGRGPRLVTTEHGIARDDVVYHRSNAKARVMATAHTARLRRFHAAIAVSEATADAMVEKWHPRVRPVVIPNGVDVVVSRLAPLAPQPPNEEPLAPQPPNGDPLAPQPSTDGGLRVLSLARLSPEKRLPALVDGFAELHRAHPEARLTLAGTGPEKTALASQVALLGLTEAVSMPGFVDPEQAMAEHDVLAMLSVWENCSYALLDAAGRGMGVVASNVGGNPEILPATSLVTAEDTTAVAAALAAQGLDEAARPGLSDWPSVADMCARIAETYAAAGAR